MRDGKIVILYVDDDSDMLSSMRFILENSGFIMEEASSAEEGLKRYKEINPDFIIVDLMMEEVDSGINFIKEIKILNNKAPIYMLSSVGGDLRNMVNYRELGLDGIFQKPVDPKTIVTTIKSKVK